VYGIGPARTVEEIASGHGAQGVDERISEHAFADMLRFLWLAVIEVAAAR